MNAAGRLWGEGDAVGQATALLLLLMSIASWSVIAWKAWRLRRARADMAAALPAFWAAGTLSEGRRGLAGLDRDGHLAALLDAALATPAADSLEAGSATAAQLTRRLRDALHRVLARLRSGQVLLASVGSTAPFVGLFGTVRGIQQALQGIAAAGSSGLDSIAGPVGAALVMTAAGLAVAIPAVLAYNVFGQRIGACEAELEGFAHDLRELFAGAAPPA